MNQSLPDVMVCDDDAPFRRRLARSFRDREYRVYEAESAREGLAVYEEYLPKWVVVDLRMPEINGLWLVEQICSRSDDAKIVVLTGFGSIQTATQAGRLGAINYVTKPASLKQIISAFSPAGLEIAEDAYSSLAEVEAEYVQRILDQCDGNVSKSAKVLGLHRRSLQRLLKRL